MTYVVFVIYYSFALWIKRISELKLSLSEGDELPAFAIEGIFIHLNLNISFNDIIYCFYH